MAGIAVTRGDAKGSCTMISSVKGTAGAVGTIGVVGGSIVCAGTVVGKTAGAKGSVAAAARGLATMS